MLSTINIPEERTHSRAALDWLVRSQTATGTGGSAAYYSPVLGWSEPYPETTGYIIPTLWQGADEFNDSTYADSALRMADWLVTLQDDSGWFPGGLYRSGKRTGPSIFNSGQIVFGLVATAQRTGEDTYRAAAERAVRWLIDQQDKDGRWTKHAYVPNYSPSYYAHVCWPLSIYWRCFGGDNVRECVERGLAAVLQDRNPNGTFRRWGFRESRDAVTHTIAYTLQGIIESSLLLDRWDDFGAPAAESAIKLLRRYEIDHRLSGSYDESWTRDFSFRCLTGECQIASTWLRIYDRQRDARLLNAAAKLLGGVCQRQNIASNENTRGAIAGSTPLYGKYLRLRYPNWAAKFFVDGLFELAKALGQLSAPPQSSLKRAA